MVIYRGFEQEKDKSVVLKKTAGQYPGIEERGKYRNE